MLKSILLDRFKRIQDAIHTVRYVHHTAFAAIYSDLDIKDQNVEKAYIGYQNACLKLHTELQRYLDSERSEFK